MENTMYRWLIRHWRPIWRAVLAGFGSCVDLAHDLWAAHVTRVVHDPAYAAAAFVVLAGMVGALPAEDVLAGIVAVIEAYLIARAGGRTTGSWDGGDAA
jgi:hypothetical protein